MASVSVAEAARRLGVGVPRIHQRIADGSLRAERIGSQWVVDERSLLRAAEHKAPGRPLSARSAWALVAVAEGDRQALTQLAPAERARAKARLDSLLTLVSEPAKAEADVRRIASALRWLFRNRAERQLRKAASADLPGLRDDTRWISLISSADSGIAAAEVEGYVAASDVKPLEHDFLLMPADLDANVVIHVLPEGQRAYPGSKLLLAADLADHRHPREELRATELLREVAEEHKAAPTMTVLPQMPREQTASWIGLLDIYDHLNEGWTLIGGQLVHLHCAERGHFPVRPTNDADTVVDVRADPTILFTFTKVLTGLGFESAGITAEGRQHRWKRGDASIDVLLPEGAGERASLRAGVTGSPTLPTQGGTQALRRSQTVAVTVSTRQGFVRRPNLVGALVVKAAAHGNPGDHDPRRHRQDFAVLAALLTAGDFAAEELSKTDRRRLRSIIMAINADQELLLDLPDARSSIDRLMLAANLG